MSQFAEYDQYDALGLAQLIQNKEITPLELINTAIAKAQQCNPTINAIVTPMYEQAREYAAHINMDASFAGVPLLVKDSGAYCQGVRTMFGSRLFEHFVPDHDSEIVTRYKAAGLNIFGRTNMPEFGLKYTTEPEAFGPTLNPWNITRTAGGSSGGAAAAVAAGILPIAHGSDGGGSLRVPAACCGVFAMKPTRARTPFGPDYTIVWGGLVIQHAMSRSVRDNAALLDVSSQPDIGEPFYAPQPKETYLEGMQRSPGQLKIALVTQAAFGVLVDQECVKAVEQAAALCESLGHKVEPAELVFDFEAMSHAFTVITSVCLHQDLSNAAALMGVPVDDKIEPVTRMYAEKGKQFSTVDYLNACNIMYAQSRIIGAFFEKYDVLLTPTIAQLPAKIGNLNGTPKNIEEYMLQQYSFAPFTGLFNQTGQPAMSVPLHWSDNNLPMGTQFVGRYGDEMTLYQLAAQLEQAQPWFDRIATVD